MNDLNKLWSSVGFTGTVDTADIGKVVFHNSVAQLGPGVTAVVAHSAEPAAAPVVVPTAFTRTHTGSIPRKCLNLALYATLLMLLSTRADADGITTWDLSNVFFNDTSQATGSLTFDSFGSQVFNLQTWDVTVNHGLGEGAFFPQLTFNPADSFFTYMGVTNLMDPEINLVGQIFDNTFNIVLAGFTLPASGTLDLATRASPFVDGRGFTYSSSETIAPTVLFTHQRFVVSGSLVLESTATPEPSTWILFGSVLLILAARKRKPNARTGLFGRMTATRT
jgi:hypothetical protein